MAEIAGTTPLDLDELKPCICCGKGIMHSGSVVFYEVTMRSCIVDVDNVRRLHGLEMAMGGAAPLARVFAPSTTVAHRIGMPARHLLCADCAMKAEPPIRFIDTGEQT